MVVLLPNEGISINDYIWSLSGEKVHAMLQNKKDTSLSITMLPFKSSYDGLLNESFEKMGISDIFDPTKIEQTAFGIDGQLYYGDTIHKTYIEVNTYGTKAAAATGMSVSCKGIPDLSISVNRPFVYMIIDCENGIPLFLGTVMDPTN